MLPARFELHRPMSVAEALAMKVRYGDDAAYFAGGTEMLIALKARVLQYDHLIDIKRLPGLDAIRLSADGALTIGALCSHHTIANDPQVRRVFPAYAYLSEHVANIRVRAAGTIGGNLCFAEPHADPPALLCAADACLHLVGPDGERRVAMRDFIVGEFTTRRDEGELLLAVEFPRALAGMTASYRSFGSTERPAVGVATARDASQAQPWRFWVGALGSKPRALEATQNVANGLPRDLAAREFVAEVALALKEEADTLEAHDDIHGSGLYKRHLVTVLARRTIEACIS